MDGRLQKELKYSRENLNEGYGSTNDIVLQTGDSVLTSASLLRHYEILRAALEVKVYVKKQ